MKVITSDQNTYFKQLLSLKTSRGIKKEKKCLIFGKNLVNEYLQSKKGDAEKIHYKEEISPDILITKELYKRLTPFQTEEMFLSVPLPEIKEYNDLKEMTGLTVFLPVGDPKNLGALLRTCMAFHVNQIVLLKEAAHPFLPEAIKSSAGCSLKAPLYEGPSLEDLQSSKDLWTLDAKGISIATWASQQRVQNQGSLKIVVGEEGGALPEKLLKQSLSIPISPEVESLNVNSALSCILFYHNLFSKS